MRFLFSLLCVLPAFADSVFVGGQLMNTARANQLANWFGQGDQQFTNISSIAGSTVGGSALFHGNVDGMGPTFILIQTDLGLIGGYNPVSWNTSGSYTINATDVGRTGFIFDLGNPTVLRQRLGADNGRFQTYNFSGYGPTFGGGHDLVVNSPSLSFGYVYAFTYGTNSLNVLGQTGQTSFTVSRVEAYTAAPYSPPPPPVPEPTTVTLIGAALGGLAFLKRKKFESR